MMSEQTRNYLIEENRAAGSHIVLMLSVVVIGLAVIIWSVW
jgi:hypothetical protein